METFEHYKESVDLSRYAWFKLLKEAREALVNKYLLEGPEAFESLNINYHPPMVQRLWLQHDENIRIMLHVIDPCDVALHHPHPWPSAVEVITGDYEMGVGTTQADDLAVMRVRAGSRYVMTNPSGSHYVRPLGKPSLSIMVIGRPYSPDVREIPHTTPSRQLQPLQPWIKYAIWEEFCKELGVDVGFEQRRAFLDACYAKTIGEE